MEAQDPNSYTVLFADCVVPEANKNIPVGKKAEVGFSASFLRSVASLSHVAPHCEVVDLMSTLSDDKNLSLLPVQEREEGACVLVLKKSYFDSVSMQTDAAYVEARDVDFDLHTTSRGGKILNAHSRQLVYADYTPRKEKNMKTGEHTKLCLHKDLPFLDMLNKEISKLLFQEGGFIPSCCDQRYPSILNGRSGIGFHGHGESRQSVILRLGPNSALHPLHFMWFLNSFPCSDPVSISLSHGDVLVFCGKSIGTDWLSKKLPTLRHATGFLKHGPCPKVNSVEKQNAKRKREESTL